MELEIPCLNFIEEFGGLWEPEADGSTNVAYGGIRLVMPKGVKGLLRAIFPRYVRPSWCPKVTKGYCESYFPGMFVKGTGIIGAKKRAQVSAAPGQLAAESIAPPYL